MVDMPEMKVKELGNVKEAYNYLTIQLLFTTIFAGTEQTKRYQYVRCVTELLRILRKHMPTAIAQKIETEKDELNKELGTIEEGQGTATQKEQKALDAKFVFMDGLMPYVHDCISASPIMERQIDGVLIYDKDDENLTHFSKLVRRTIPMKELKRGDTMELVDKKPTSKK